MHSNIHLAWESFLTRYYQPKWFRNSKTWLFCKERGRGCHTLWQGRGIPRQSTTLRKLTVFFSSIFLILNKFSLLTRTTLWLLTSEVKKKPGAGLGSPEMWLGKGRAVTKLWDEGQTHTKWNEAGPPPCVFVHFFLTKWSEPRVHHWAAFLHWHELQAAPKRLRACTRSDTKQAFVFQLAKHTVLISIETIILKKPQTPNPNKSLKNKQCSQTGVYREFNLWNITGHSKYSKPNKLQAPYLTAFQVQVVTKWTNKQSEMTAPITSCTNNRGQILLSPAFYKYILLTIKSYSSMKTNSKSKQYQNYTFQHWLRITDFLPPGNASHITE